MAYTDLENDLDSWLYFDDGADMVMHVAGKSRYFWVFYTARVPPKLDVEYAQITGEFGGSMRNGAVLLFKLPPSRALRNKHGLLSVDLRELRARRLMQQIEETYAPGDPIELSGGSGRYGVLVHKSTRRGVPWQASVFDKLGPITHFEGHSVDEVVEKAVEDGFATGAEPGAVERILSSGEIVTPPGYPKQNPFR